MVNHLRNIPKAIYKPEFYRRIPGTSTGNAVLYFVLLSLLSVIFLSISILPPLYQTLRTFVVDGSNYIKDSYPADLTITVKDGIVSTNAQEPYTFPLPEEMREMESNDDDVKNLIVIDTKTPFSQEQFEKYDTIAWLTKDTLFIGDESQTRAQDLSEIDDFTLNRNEIQKFFSEVSPLINGITPFFLVFMVLFLLVFKLFTLLYLFVIAFLFWILTKVFSITISYGDLYKMSIYAATLGVILEIVLQPFKTSAETPYIPYLFTLSTLVVFAVNVLFRKDLWHAKTVSSTTRKTTKKNSK